MCIITLLFFSIYHATNVAVYVLYKDKMLKIKTLSKSIQTQLKLNCIAEDNIFGSHSIHNV